MTSKNRIVGYLEEEDHKLFKVAEEKYKIKESELFREIVHAWLFSNKLQLKN